MNGKTTAAFDYNVFLLDDSFRQLLVGSCEVSLIGHMAQKRELEQATEALQIIPTQDHKLDPQQPRGHTAGSDAGICDFPDCALTPMMDQLPQREQIGTYTHVIVGLLNRTECNALISGADHVGLSRHRSGSRDQFVFHSNALADGLALRLQALVPDRMVGRPGSPKEGELWSFAGLNTHFRMTRYMPPLDELSWHMDAVKFAGPQCCSAFTLTIYLTDASPEDGGSTDFDVTGGASPIIWVPSLQPVVGSALLLAHDVVHRGASLTDGASPKYILRTEILYESAQAFADDVVGTSVEDGAFDLIWPAPSASVRELHHRIAKDRIEI